MKLLLLVLYLTSPALNLPCKRKQIQDKKHTNTKLEQTNTRRETHKHKIETKKYKNGEVLYLTSPALNLPCKRKQIQDEKHTVLQCTSKQIQKLRRRKIQNKLQTNHKSIKVLYQSLPCQLPCYQVGVMTYIPDPAIVNIRYSAVVKCLKSDFQNCGPTVSNF